MYPPEYQNIIKEICKNNSIKYKEYDNNCILLEYNHEKKFIWSRRFPHNSVSSARLIDSKYTCSCVLDSAGIPTIVHQKIYRSDTEGYKFQKVTGQQICEKILMEYGGVVVKPNDSYEGKNVFACFSNKEIEQALANVFKTKEIIVASPFFDACAEYRVFYLDGECLLAYKKILPFVVGNGMLNVGELISRTNWQAKDFHPAIDYSYIPRSEEKVVVGWKFNLSCGSMPEIVQDNKLKNDLFSLAKKAALEVDASFVTVDILEHSISKKHIILELNAGVAMDQFIIKHNNGKIIAYQIYEKAIRNLFNISK